MDAKMSISYVKDRPDYGGWQDLDNENSFDWNLAN